MKNIKLLFIASLVLFIGCQKDYEGNDKSFETENNRVTLKNQIIPVVPGFGLKSQPDDPELMYEFTLVAEVDAPEVDGQVVQATHVEIVGNWALVSYNMRGSQQLGAIDIIDIANPAMPVILHSIQFDDKDVNTVGWRNGHIVLAGQDMEGAYYGLYSINDETLEIHRLQSYSAMSMVVKDNHIYVVSGDTGGLTVIDPDGAEDFIYFSDARSVAANDEVYVLTSEGISVVNGDNISIDPGYIQYASKAELTLSYEYLFAAVNRGGVHIFDLEDLSLFQVLDRPVTPEGMDDEDFVTNSVSFNEPLLFVGNGGAGVMVSGKSDLFKTDPQFVTYGYFDFDGPLSTNFVKSQGNYVFVATGLGGLKILTIQEIPDDDDCIWTSETAFAGSEQGGGAAWWFYIDNTGKSQHPIYAGQQLIEGAYVEINPISGSDNVEIIIELGDKMMLQPGSETVKIQGYNHGQLPSSRPPAGLFTTYKGNELIIEVPCYPYYVVHLDVKVCNEP
jgi:hypothetical protein